MSISLSKCPITTFFDFGKNQILKIIYGGVMLHTMALFFILDMCSAMMHGMGFNQELESKVISNLPEDHKALEFSNSAELNFYHLIRLYSV